MPKMMLHRGEARAALARGVGKLALAVEGTLGPKGTNAIIDRPIGTPLISRDGVSIAAEIELPCRFENMGAQVVREVSKQTNDVAGDGTTTATVLANALIQDGVGILEAGVRAVDLVAGMDRACDLAMRHLRRSARPLKDDAELEHVASVAATDPALGRMIAEALARVGPEGIVEVEYGVPGTKTVLEVIEGMAFDRGFISHHMATDGSSMRAVLDDPCILLTDHRIADPDAVVRILDLASRAGRPLLIVADEVSPETIAALMAARRDGRGLAVAVNPPEFGHWRKAMMEDIPILTGGRVVVKELGGRLDSVTLDDLGSAEQVRVTNLETAIVRGRGDVAAIRARRALVQHLLDTAPPNVERDKLAERLAKLSHGTAILRTGGATPVEQKRLAQLLEDSLNAARAAREEGVVAGGGTALVQIAPGLDELAEASRGGEREGVRLVQRAIVRPLACIAENCGTDGAEVVARVAGSPPGVGFDAQAGTFGDMFAAGVIDPVKVTCTALQNAVSVAKLILTTHTLVADLPEHTDPTAGPALGGGAEKYGRA